MKELKALVVESMKSREQPQEKAPVVVEHEAQKQEAQPPPAPPQETVRAPAEPVQRVPASAPRDDGLERDPITGGIILSLRKEHRTDL